MFKSALVGSRVEVVSDVVERGEEGKEAGRVFLRRGGGLTREVCRGFPWLVIL